MENKIKVFESKQVRTLWNPDEEEWYFSVVDVVAALTDSADPKQYVKKMRARDTELSAKWGTICTPVEMVGLDGKKRKIQAASTKNILRIIQSIPSPKAEPFKLWLAQVGSERLDEIADPEKAILRGADYYRAKGYPDGWINQRLQTIEMRNKLTDEWKARGITRDKEYAILTDEMTVAWSGMTVREYKAHKGLKKESLRDNMTDIELVLNMLAGVTTTALSKSKQPTTFNESEDIAREGGATAKEARHAVERRLGHTVVTSRNATDKPALEVAPSEIKQITPNDDPKDETDNDDE